MDPRIRNALMWLDEHFSHFMTSVLNLGTPVITDAVERTGLVPDNSHLGFSFGVNPDYANVDPALLATSLAHDTLHVLLGHFGAHPRLTDLPRKKRAMELVVHDYLDGAGFPLEPVEHGIDVIGANAAQLGLEDVYDMLFSPPEPPEPDPSKSAPAGEDVNPSGTGDGTGDEAADGTADETADDLSNSSPDSSSGAPGSGCTVSPDFELDPEVAEQAAQKAQAAAGDDLPTELNPTDAKSGLGAGSSFFTSEQYADANGVSLRWTELLKVVNPDILKRPGGRRTRVKTSFHSPHRRLTHLYPELIVPSTRPRNRTKKKGDEKPMLILALDTSGSIPVSTVKTLTELARSVPSNLVEVRVCTFSTYHVPFDIELDRQPTARGGTDFSAVVSFIDEQNLKSYPKAVVVITDGEASFGSGKPTQPQLDSWHWLLTSSDSYYESYLRRLSGTEQVDDLNRYI